MTITCATCGQDSGVRWDDLLEEALHGSRLDGWACAPPRIGEPFQFWCPACTEAGHARAEETPP